MASNTNNIIKLVCYYSNIIILSLYNLVGEQSRPTLLMTLWKLCAHCARRITLVHIPVLH